VRKYLHKSPLDYFIIILYIVLPKRNKCYKKETKEMIINNVMDEVFSTGSNVRVLRVLNQYTIGLSGREVARLSHLSPKNCIITLTALENIGIVRRERGTGQHSFTLDRNQSLNKKILIPLFEKEDEHKESINEIITKKLKKITKSIILFGSVARNEETINSDFDLCIIYEKNKRAIEEIIYEEISPELRRKYNISFSPFLITLAKFRSLSKINNSAVPDIIKEGKLISGISIRSLINDKRRQKTHS